MEAVQVRTSSSSASRRRQKIRDAEAKARNVLRKHPTDAEALIVLATLRIDRGDEAEALRLLEQALYCRTDQFSAFERLANLYVKLGRGNDACEVYADWARQVAQNNPAASRRERDELEVESDVAKYYAARAPEYDATAFYITSGAALTAGIRAQYQAAFRDHDVLEIACGTGYWTETVAATARSITATDFNPALVSIVREKLATRSNVKCQAADAYALDGVTGPFTAAFSQFWWSHIPKTKIRSFLTTLNSKLEPGALVMLMDSLPYPFQPPRWINEAGDVVEERTLLNGERHEILKNFPTQSEIAAALDGIADDIVFTQSCETITWTLSYRTKSATASAQGVKA